MVRVGTGAVLSY